VVDVDVLVDSDSELMEVVTRVCGLARRDP
jgi:hypothetical protein